MSELIKNRSSALMLIEVKGANPNGDPDWGNLPRTINGTQGFITSVCIKRQIRNVLEDHQSPCFQELIQRLKFDPEQFHIFESKNRGFEEGISQFEATKRVFDLMRTDMPLFKFKFWDPRVLGGTILEENNKESKEKGKDKKLISYTKTGCLTISPAFSIAPIQIEEATISKLAPTREVTQDLAPSACKFVVHGLYVANISINPNVAHKTGATTDDIEILKALLPHIFSLSQAAARPAGSINLVHIWWRDHTKALGSFNENEWFKKMTPRYISGDKDSTSLADYDIPQPDASEGTIDLMKGAWK